MMGRSVLFWRVIQSLWASGVRLTQAASIRVETKTGLTACFIVYFLNLCGRRLTAQSAAARPRASAAASRWAHLLQACSERNVKNAAT